MQYIQKCYTLCQSDSPINCAAALNMLGIELRFNQKFNERAFFHLCTKGFLKIYECLNCLINNLYNLY